MEVDVCHSRDTGVNAGKELRGRARCDDPDLVFLFPTAEHHSRALIKQMVRGLDVDCPVIGVSVGALAAPGSDGFETDAVAALFFDGASVLHTQQIDEAWQTSVDEAAAALTRYDAETCFTCSPGPRDMPNTLLARAPQQLSNAIIHRNTLGQRERAIDNLLAMGQRLHIGYPRFMQATYRQLPGTDKQFINYLSADAGRYQTGYELYNTAVTESTQAVVLDTDITVEMRAGRRPETTLEQGDLVETFTDIDAYNQIIYRLDGATLPELYDQYPINKAATAGGITHYFLLETQDAVITLGAPGDIPVIASTVPVPDDASIHLVRTTGFLSYRTVIETLLDTTTGFPHINLFSGLLNLYYNRIDDLPTIADQQRDTYLLTLNMCTGTPEDTFYPTAVNYHP